MGIKCPKCDFENPDDTLFCGKCATQLPSPEKVEVTETLETPKEELTTGSTFAGRYQIIEELGKGGMGRVYKAHDTKIKEKIALKLIKPEIAKDKKTIERFSNELRLARKIRHKNVCGMFDLGEEKGTHYITMEFVPGEDLRSSVRRFGQLPIGKSISIAKQICEGLAEAHRLGVVHRDLKSNNIMIDKEGNVRIMDFGIARSIEAKGITGAGVMIGTPEYMSPEQVEGEEADQRSDIYSLGVILYEMVTGRVPFEGETPLGIAMKHKSEAPKDPREINALIPEDLSHVILRCMEKDKDKRYQGAEELLSELSKIGEGKVKEEKIGEIKLEKSIVVLPFEDISPGRDNEYFSDGLTEEVISDLSKVRDLRVISRSSAMTFKDTKKKVKEIAKEVDVQYVIEGSVRKVGNNLRITAQLIDAINDKHLWAEKYSGTLDDVFDIQEKVSHSIVNELKLKLSPEEKRKIAETPTRNIRVYECYLKAKHEIDHFTKDSLDNGINTLQNGLDIYGESALLLSTLGEAYYLYFDVGYVTDEAVLDKAEEYAKKALAIDPDSAHGHKLLGLLERGRGSLIKACEHMKRAHSIDPNDAGILLYTATIYAVYIGKPTIADPLFKKLFEIDPLTPINYVFYGFIRFMQGQFDQALELLHKSERMNPDFMWSKFWIAVVLAANNQIEEAFETFDQVIRGEEIDHIPKELSIFIKSVLKGDKEKALGPLSSDTDKFTWQPDISVWMSGFYALINETEKSLIYLEDAINKGFINFPFLNEYHPFLKNIRGEERFKKLMKRVKYEWENFEV